MSMYNLIFGKNPLSGYLLAMLGNPDVGRFRDAFVTNGKIAIYTRNGGGNRECWSWTEECEGCPGCTMAEIHKVPGYLYDQDDEFDSTYATIYFEFPDEWRELLELMDSGEKFDPDQRWLDKLEALGA